METQRILVLDGYDASGKTTLAQLLVTCLSGHYLKVFQGAIGALVGWLYDTHQFSVADVVARATIRYVCSVHQDAPCLIFDRHWVTMFALLPERYYVNWGALPKTFLCWCDAATTLRRLAERGESPRVGDDVEACCALYQRIGLRFGATLIDTTHRAPDEALAVMLADLDR